MKITKGFLYMGVLLVSMFIVVGATMASTPPDGNECGKSGPWGEQGGLIVKKNVFCEKDRSWEWKIDKWADYSSITLSEGQVLPVHYTVDVTTTPVDNNFRVSGQIYAINTSNEMIRITGVTDSLGNVIRCEYGGWEISFPFDLDSGDTIVCSYSGDLETAAAQNVATVTFGADGSLSAFASIDWSKAAMSETDECVDVSDDNVGFLGTACANSAPATFTYNLWFGSHLDADVPLVCGENWHSNTASFVTNETGTTGQDDWNVYANVACATGCTLTPGYWKTHSSFGPAPYDDTWAQIDENTLFFSSGQIYYDVLWTSPRGNAYYILAHAYIAAELNKLNGADFSAAQDAFGEATSLFKSATPDPVDQLKGADKKTWTDLASILDDYNNGLIGPGHCTE